MGFFKKVKKSASRFGKRSGTAIKSLTKGDFQTAIHSGNLATQTIASGGVTELLGIQKKGGPLERQGIKASGLVETSPGKFEKIKDLEGLKDVEKIQLQQAQIQEASRQAELEEKKRRTRRGNILTRPLGVLRSNSLATRVLTGQ